MVTVAGLGGAVIRDRPTGAAVVTAHGAVLGLAVAGFPHWDHMWLTAVERRLPVVETAFLTVRGREVRGDVGRTAGRNEAELGRLVALRDAGRLATPNGPTG